MHRIGNRIRELREAAGYATQAQLAEKMGVSQAAIQRWETGLRFPRGRNLQMLADALNVRPADILLAVATADFVTEIEPADPGPFGGHLAKVGLRPYRCIADSVSRAGISIGDIVMIDINERRPSTVPPGSLVALSARTESGSFVLLLRQFLPPNLVTTNRNGTNLALSLDDPDVELALFGVVVRD